MTVLEDERTTEGRRPAGRRPSVRRFFARNPVFYILPSIVLLLAFAAYPLFVLVRMSLSDVGPTNIVGMWNFVGLNNFVSALTTSPLWLSVLRTIEISIVLLISNLVLGFLAASILSVSGRITNIVLGIMVFVWALPPIVSGSVWKFLLDDSGAINSMLGLVGIRPVSWLSSPDLALWTCAGVIAWAALPFSALILRGGLLAIPQDVIEAAAIDGAGYWRTRWTIVLPLLRPTMSILAILTVLYAFKSFDFFYVLTQGGPGTATNTLPVYSYYTAFTNFDMSAGATIAVVSMLFVAIFAVPYVRSIRNEATE
ncbi:carbohydrate ABC transporter permease [Rathayibacter soli]|uniref:carbohydrate ABC transporter permease n=1 Tax=Rathayibacter soli TaxID=3144168 RepID=UPI0027E4DB73|nr:sugar ABC transporter permease [Glaciibacter superstes]